MDIEATDIVVTGRVQGVFYRAGMREQAERLEVAGWVRNEPDGTVRAHLEGRPQRFPSCSNGVPVALRLPRCRTFPPQPAEVIGARGSRRTNFDDLIVGFIYKHEVST